MSDTREIRARLEAHTFTEGMNGAHVDTLMEFTERRDFNGGEFLTRIGKPAEQCFLICRGLVSIEIYQPGRGSRAIETLSPADSVLGWSWLVTPHTWCFDSRAMETTETLALDTEQLREACESDHEFGYQIFKKFFVVVSERLRTTRLQLSDMYGMER